MRVVSVCGTHCHCDSAACVRLSECESQNSVCVCAVAPLDWATGLAGILLYIRRYPFLQAEPKP